MTGLPFAAEPRSAAFADHAHLVPGALRPCLESLSDVALSDDPDFLFHDINVLQSGRAGYGGVAIPPVLRYF